MKTFKQIAILSSISFLLHIVWENVQAPLFKGYESFTKHLPVCFMGTIGDVLITLFAFALIALIKNNQHWIVQIKLGDYLSLTIIGLLIAIGIEQNALFLSKWNYSDAMPLIPYLKTGLTPLIQMMVLLPLSFFLTAKWKIK